MINGSSAIHNIHTATVTEPHIRATLKYGAFIGRNWNSSSELVIYEDAKAEIFNNHYIVYDNLLDSSFSTLATYNAGGSVITTYLVGASNINGVSWNDGTELQRGDFITIGNTLEFYYLKTGATLANRYISKIFRLSSSNGLTWGGETVMNTTVQGTSNSWEYDIAVGSSRDFYTMAFDKDHDSIHYGTIGVSQQSMYTDMYLTSDNDKRINLLEFQNTRHLIIESGYKYTVKAQPEYQSLYSPYIKHLLVGTTNVYDERTIAYVDYGEDRLKLTYGGVDSGGSYAYFGIIRHNYEITFYNGSTGTFESQSTVDFVPTLCKMDATGRVYTRSFSILGFAGDPPRVIVVGGASNTHQLTLIQSAGEAGSIWYPWVETSGSSIDISSDIITYTNNDNRRISLEIGNVK